MIVDRAVPENRRVVGEVAACCDLSTLAGFGCANEVPFNHLRCHVLGRSKDSTCGQYGRSNSDRIELTTWLAMSMTRIHWHKVESHPVQRRRINNTAAFAFTMPVSDSEKKQQLIDPL